MVIGKFVKMNLTAMTIFNRSFKPFFRAVATTFLVVAFFSFYHANAQDITEDVEEEESNSFFSHRGIEASIGMRQFTLKSDVPELSNLQVLEEGGSAAFVCGNSYSRLVVRVAGLYYSNSSTRRTIDLLEMEINSNIYILKALNIPAKKVDAYVLAGISNQHMKFFGHYIDKSNRAEKKGAAGREPYLGRINTTNINLGIGIEYKMQAERDFVHIFVEAKTHFELASSTDVTPLENTSIGDFYGVNLGVRFGRRN